MFLSIAPHFHDDGFDGSRRGVLATRAWVTQEFVLSRRAVCYTPKELVWVCKTLQASEDGVVMDPPTDSSHSDWLGIFSFHAARELTFETDRLISLQGLVNKLRKRNPTDEYHWGVWMSSIHLGFLWYREGVGARVQDIFDAPSWSWASNPGYVYNFRQDIIEEKYGGALARIEVSGRALTLFSCRLKTVSSIQAFRMDTNPSP